MHVVKTLIAVVLTIALVLFAVANWQPVEVRIWSGLIVETKLPVLAIGAYLLGIVPTWALHRASMWRMRRRVAQLTVPPPAVFVAPPPPEPPAP